MICYMGLIKLFFGLFLPAKKKHNTELQRADPGTKVKGNSVLGIEFSHTMPKIDFHYSHRFN